MATKIINTIIKFKRATAAEWPSNYILQQGEPGFEIDTGKLKIGDGATAWSQLNYLNGLASINTDGALVYEDGTLSLSGLSSAETGSVPTKGYDGAITWTMPITETNITNSETINSWLENKIATINNRTYKGEAAFVTTSSLPIVVYDDEFQPIVAEINDVYSYEDKKYIWNGVEWLELTTAEFYATQQEVNYLTTRVAALEDGIILSLATEQDAGAVKSSNDINKIFVNQDGTMSVNSIGVDKLVNNGYTLILSNGQATE